MESKNSAVENALKPSAAIPVVEKPFSNREDISRNNATQDRVLQKNVIHRNGSLKRHSYLVLADFVSMLVSVGLSFSIANLLRTAVSSDYISVASTFGSSRILLITSITILVVTVSSKLMGHYSRFKSIWIELKEVLLICCFVAIGIVMTIYYTKFQFSRLWLTLFVASLAVCIPLSRYVAKLLMIQSGCWFRSTFIVGVGDSASKTALAYDSDKFLGLRVDGFVDLFQRKTTSTYLGRKVFRTSPSGFDYRSLNEELPVMVFALDSEAEFNDYRYEFNEYVAKSSHVTVVPPLNGLPLQGANVESIYRKDVVLLKLQNKINRRYARRLKRAFDLFASIIGLIVLLPVLVAIFLIVKSDGGPAVFSHKRLGRSGKNFYCLKFRTMVTNADTVLSDLLDRSPEMREHWENDQKLKNDPRITKIGRFLRKTSLDELPQLFNVLKGEMSLVGPRPIVQDEVQRYGEFIGFYYTTTPGLTGLWQTNGRNSTTYAERVQLDVWYSRNWSFWNDIVIILRTFPILINRNGAY